MGRAHGRQAADPVATCAEANPRQESAPPWSPLAVVRRSSSRRGRKRAAGDLDPTFSGDGKQTTAFGFGASNAAATVHSAGRQDRRGRRRRSTVRRLRARPLQPQRLARHELLRRRQAEDRLQVAASTRRTGWRSRATARSSWSARADEARLVRARPLQPQRLARHELLRRRQADDRLRRRRDEATGVALQANGKIVVVGSPRIGRTSAFALARYNPNGSLDTSFSGDGKQTTDFGGVPPRRRGDRGRAPGRRQDRRGRHPLTAATSRSPATTPTARSTRASPATASRRPTSGQLRRCERGGAPGERQDRRGRRAARCAAATSRSPATTPTARSTRASRATASRRPTSGGRRRSERGGAPGRRQDRRGGWPRGAGEDFALARYNPNGSLDTSFSGDGKQTTNFGDLDGGGGVALQANGKIVAVGGASGTGAATSRSPATTPTARSTRASPATASRRPTSWGRRREADGVALQGDGRIVAVGSQWRLRR